ncbi:hypothetical protein pb186bvf_010485, partial [Paramecium bursaria]
MKSLRLKILLNNNFSNFSKIYPDSNKIKSYSSSNLNIHYSYKFIIFNLKCSLPNVNRNPSEYNEFMDQIMKNIQAIQNLFQSLSLKLCLFQLKYYQNNFYKEINMFIFLIK